MTTILAGLILAIVRPAPCHYLGCGALARRIAYDRLYNRVRACGDPAHGKEIGS